MLLTSSAYNTHTCRPTVLCHPQAPCSWVGFSIATKRMNLTDELYAVLLTQELSSADLQQKTERWIKSRSTANYQLFSYSAIFIAASVRNKLIHSFIQLLNCLPPSRRLCVSQTRDQNSFTISESQKLIPGVYLSVGLLAGLHKKKLQANLAEIFRKG